MSIGSGNDFGASGVSNTPGGTHSVPRMVAPLTPSRRCSRLDAAAPNIQPIAESEPATPTQNGESPSVRYA